MNDMQAHAAFAQAASSEYSDYHVARPPAEGLRAGTMFSWLGSVLSLALLAGVGFWGWQLMVRDVSGVPVVQAFEGPVRVAPDDPGGRQAAYQGLSVNEISASGQAGELPGAVALAPSGVALSDEDIPVARAQEMQPDAPSSVPAARDPFAPDLATGPVPVAFQVPAPAADLAPARTDSADTPPPPPVQIIPASIPGPSASPRPPSRPGGAQAAPAPTQAAQIAPQTGPQTGPQTAPQGQDLAAELAAQVAARMGGGGRSIDIDPATLERGTRLVQLGVHDSREAAVAAWDGLARRVSPHMEQLDRVIEAAHSGGSVFYRLRAHGFADDAAARRFCAVLDARQADCIPALVR